MATKKVFLNFLLAFALFCPEFGFSGDPYEALRDEINRYTQEHVVPVMLAQRRRLDNYLSKNDQQIISQLQSEYRVLLKEKNTLFETYRGQGTKIMQQWELLRSQQTEIWQQALEISYRYDKVLKSLLVDEVMEKRRLWRREMNQIVDKYNTLIDSSRQALFKKHDFGEFMTPVGFLLWSMPEAENGEAEAEDGPQVFPNPTVLNNTIKFTLQNEEEVIISLLDSQGKFIKIYLKETLSPGTHQFEIPLKDLPGNLYFYKISKASGTEVKKFVKE